MRQHVGWSYTVIAPFRASSLQPPQRSAMVARCERVAASTSYGLSPMRTTRSDDRPARSSERHIGRTYRDRRSPAIPDAIGKAMDAAYGDASGPASTHRFRAFVGMRRKLHSRLVRGLIVPAARPRSAGPEIALDREAAALLHANHQERSDSGARGRIYFVARHLAEGETSWAN